jgi:hypothetical protein
MVKRKDSTGSVSKTKNGKWIVRWSVRDAEAKAKRRQRWKAFPSQQMAEAFQRSLSEQPSQENTDVSVQWMLTVHRGNAHEAIRYLLHEIRKARQMFERERKQRIEAEDETLFRYLVQTYGSAKPEPRKTDPIQGRLRIEDAKRVAVDLIKQHAPNKVRTKDILAATGVSKGSSSLQLLKYLESHKRIRKDDLRQYQWAS